MGDVPAYKLTTGVVAGLQKEYIKTVTVVTTVVVDAYGMVIDRQGLVAIRQRIAESQRDTNAPQIIVFVRASS